MTNVLGIHVTNRFLPENQVAMEYYGLFVVVAFSFWMADYSSCGCFGFVDFSPFFMFVFDSVIVAGCVVALFESTRTEDASATKPICFMTEFVAAGLFVTGALSTAAILNEQRRDANQDEQIALLSEKQDQIIGGFPLDIRSGAWEIPVLKQSCPKCESWLANRARNRPMMVVMLVNDYAKYCQDRHPSCVTPIVVDTQSMTRIASPAIVHINNGKIVSFVPVFF